MFDPNRRLKPLEALAQPYFDELRDTLRGENAKVAG
jgi:hypothetical protein